MRILHLALFVLLLAVAGNVHSQEIETRRYHLVLFVYRGLGEVPAGADDADPLAAPVDPFAAPAEEYDWDEVPPVEEQLDFPEGTEVTYDVERALLTATGPSAVLESIEAQLPGPVMSEGERQMQIIVEVIEVATTDFSTWVYRNRMSVDAGPLYRAVGEWLEAGRGTRLEILGGVARSGQRAVFKGVGQIYIPTEADPTVALERVDLEEGTEAPLRPVNPTAWEEKELGARLEVDAILQADNRTIDLNLAPEIVEHAGTRIVPIDQSLTSLYEQRITTEVTTIDGHYTLLGSTHPRENRDRALLWFVRADVLGGPQWRRLSEKETR